MYFYMGMLKIYFLWQNAKWKIYHKINQPYFTNASTLSNVVFGLKKKRNALWQFKTKWMELFASKIFCIKFFFCYTERIEEKIKYSTSYIEGIFVLHWPSTNWVLLLPSKLTVFHTVFPTWILEVKYLLMKFYDLHFHKRAGDNAIFPAKSLRGIFGRSLTSWPIRPRPNIWSLISRVLSVRPETKPRYSAKI